MRNPFRKQDENVRPSTSINDSLGKDDSNKSIDVKEKEPVEYQLSGELEPIAYNCVDSHPVSPLYNFL